MDMCVPITARIPGIHVDTHLPPQVDEDGMVLSDVIKLMQSDNSDGSAFVCWTCEHGFLDALALTHPQNFKFKTTEISKEQCFVSAFTEAERAHINQAGMDENNLVKAIMPFTEAELQSQLFIQLATQRMTVLRALNQASLNDEDELLVLGQMTIRASEDTDEQCLLFLSLIKGFSLIHINVMNAVSPLVSEDEVASSDLTRLVPASTRERISQVMCISTTRVHATQTLLLFSHRSHLCLSHRSMTVSSKSSRSPTH